MNDPPKSNFSRRRRSRSPSLFGATFFAEIDLNFFCWANCKKAPCSKSFRNAIARANWKMPFSCFVACPFSTLECLLPHINLSDTTQTFLITLSPECRNKSRSIQLYLAFCETSKNLKLLCSSSSISRLLLMTLHKSPISTSEIFPPSPRYVL